MLFEFDKFKIIIETYIWLKVEIHINWNQRRMKDSIPPKPKLLSSPYLMKGSRAPSMILLRLQMSQKTLPSKSVRKLNN